MIAISNSLPVRFWLNGVLTFNETLYSGIVPQCFRQMWECADTIKVQFTDSTDLFYDLVSYDINGVQTSRTAFIEVSTGIYELNFVPSDNASCKLTQLKIEQYQNFILNPNFDTDLSHWTNSGAGIDWVWGGAGGGSAIVPGLAAGTPVSKDLICDSFALKPIGRYKSRLLTFMIAAAKSALIEVKIYNAGVFVQTIHSVTQAAIAPTIDDVTFNAVAPFDRIRMTVTRISGTSFNCYVSVSTVQALTVIAKSDYLDIQTEHPDTRLIQASNKNVFDGLDFSHDQVFGIRVWSKFYLGKSIQVSAGEDLTDGEIVILSNSEKNQRFFEAEQAPEYFHQIVASLLSCNTVKIDGDYWSKEEVYEYNQMDERYPFYLGKCWLTKQGSYKTNVYGSQIAIT